ncbi:MAG: tRNA uridine-5-carboxymethylaminomethyl(34) synthesis GTPase MnmE [Oscillospiraceae bacterium]|nr:tRNA uridine-5-carboxymethylaminomethyl(34) synthesis GTPase MnmE [Oscillospiraceae bacterium]MDY3064676.1 tRNA uridine-5-carboxymethylaminomethyl(34) synthesis GTPase MnmE [Oscillospiraceae bacterium]
MTQTIAAIATPAAAGGISVIRISGSDALTIADRVFSAKSGIPLSGRRGYTAAFGDVVHHGEVLDEAVATVFNEPHSYTGENVVELSCHGGLYLTQEILRVILENGARLAEAGEFTKRAFLNGKMSLSQAEAVMDLIGAQGREAARAAHTQLSGALSRQITAVKDALLRLAGHLSAWVDYPEEEIPEVDEEEILLTAGEASKTLRTLLSQFDTGKLIREGIDTVIVGKPNVGKSTLMNLLSRCERSIVTDVAGTTRDIVEETVRLGQLVLRVADTAGIRETEDVVEQIGVSLAKRRMQEASLVLAVFDGSSEWSPEDEKILPAALQPSIAVVNKSDLPTVTNLEKIRRAFSHMVVLSATDPESLAVLEREIRETLNLSEIDPFAPMLSNERQRLCAMRAADLLEQAQTAVKAGVTFDAVTVLIEEAIDALLELTGERTTDAVIDAVFANFCVGK